MKIFSTFTGIGGFEIGIQGAFESHRTTQQTNADNGNSADHTSDTQRYKMCGNAVTTNVIQAVFERIFLS